MTKTNAIILALLSTYGVGAYGAQGTASGNPNEIRLYQVGRNGNYCLSTSKDESGCISGSDKDGTPVNVMDVIKGKNVVFENLSDAPHDMHFTGANAGDIPPQFPGAPDAAKKMDNEDMSKQKITCSFHGDQLGIGYRVPDVKKSANVAGDGHKERGENVNLAEGGQGRGGNGGGGGKGGRGGRGGERGATGGGEGGGEGGGAGVGDSTNVTPTQALVRTGLSDVSGEVLAKGSAEDVKKLIEARPELKAKLAGVRPLLAAELAAGGGGDASGGGAGGSGSGSGGAAKIAGNPTLPNGVAATDSGDASGAKGGGNGTAGATAKGKASVADGAVASLEKGFGSLTQALGTGDHDKLGVGGKVALGADGRPVRGAAAGGGGGAGGGVDGAVAANGEEDPTKLQAVEASLSSRGPLAEPINWLMLGIGLFALLAGKKLMSSKREEK